MSFSNTHVKGMSNFTTFDGTTINNEDSKEF